MARRNLIWHIGPLDLGGVQLPRLLEADQASDYRRLAAAEAHDADQDLRRAYEPAGRSRKDVEGSWSRLESKVWHHKGTWMLSTPSVHLATEDQRHLAMDGLRGVKVQIVVLRTPESADVAEGIARRWLQPLHPERLHVIDTDGSVGAAWQALFDVAGLPSRPVPGPRGHVLPGTAAAGVLGRVIGQQAGRADVVASATGLLSGGDEEEDELAAASRALTSAASELVAAEQRIRELLADNERLDRKRRKHKRRLRALRARLDDSREELEHVTV